MAFFTTKWIAIRRCSQFVEQLNCLFVYEVDKVPKQHCQLILSRVESLSIKFVQFCAISTGMIMPVAYGLMHLIIPCSPATFAYFLNPECTDLVHITGIHSLITRIPFQEILLPIGSAFVAVWALTDSIGMFAIIVGQALFIGSCVLIYFLRSFRLLASRPSGVIAKVLITYRDLQVHNLYFNQIHLDVNVIVVMWAMAYSFTVAMYALLKYANQVSLPQLVIFVNATLATGIVIIVVYGIFAKVNVISQNVLAFLRERVLPEMKGSAVERKWMKRYLRSLSPLKVRVGQVNYVDNFTPLVMLQFCFGQICNLMVM